MGSLGHPSVLGPPPITRVTDWVLPSVCRRHCRSSFPTLKPTLAWVSENWTDNVGGRHSPTLTNTQADVGGRRWCKRRKTGLKNVGGWRRPGVRQCRPPTSTILSVVEPPISLVILCNFSLYVAVHFNSQLYVTHLLSHCLLSIRTHPPLILTLQWIPVEKIRAVPAARTCDLPLTQLALYHLTACMPV